MVSIFSRIIAREIPSYIVYEDDQFFAFLDIHPLHLGHTLLVPKKEIGNILEMDDLLYTEMMMVAKNILGPAIQKATNCVRVGYSVEGFWVPDHVHLHLIPLMQIGDMDPSKAHTESPENMAAMAEKIHNSLPV
jgi:histidine triad (HIT) family protein